MIGALIIGGASLFAGLAGAEANQEQAMQSRIAAVRRRLRASDDARIVEEQGNRFQANQAVGFAKSGVLLDQGSPLATLMDTAINVEKNAMRARLAGEWDADGLESSASAYDKMATGAMIKGIAGAVSAGVQEAKSRATAYTPGLSRVSNGVTEKSWMKEYGND